jgi:hypothetical protein
MIANRFVTYVLPGNLGFPLGKINCSQGEVSFSLGSLGFSSRKIHCSHGKLCFSPKNFSFSMKNCLGPIFGLFLPREIT